ncbi:MAG: bifunctional helix-turn-helix transcriptional regulator/GNAT family N-acetyltransferase [Pyrinomonadaceae bacterium]|nr:bifunctional helix-turn-helix transcriptional regulator/GNAT family N-acetyltransferase [Pyrinomonadaceae bacterium]
MEQDFLSELGFLSFVTRLKRASDAMLHDGRKLYKTLGMEIEPNWFVVFKLLQEKGELTVTEIANEIGFAHPSVITIINKMLKKGYVESRQCDIDSRRRLLVLSEKARRAMPEFERVWSAGVTSVKRMLADTDALGFLDILETRIAKSGFRSRTLKCLDHDASVKIVEFEPEYARDFADLNYEWIEEMYEIEEHDREQLENPDLIINAGGQILLALIGRQAVGTVALIQMEEPGSFELAKMAVTRDFRGLQIGKKLMVASIEYSKRVGKKRIILESNRKQIPAVKMYRDFGFIEIEQDPNSEFQRADIRMKLEL